MRARNTGEEGTRTWRLLATNYLSFALGLDCILLQSTSTRRNSLAHELSPTQDAIKASFNCVLAVKQNA